MTPAQLSRTVLHTVRRAVEDGELCVAVPERIVVRRPPRPGNGDYATNVALCLASEAGRPARRVAETLRARLVRVSGIAGVEVSGPGFLNITVAGDGRAALVADLIRGSEAPTALPGTALEENPRQDALRWLAATEGQGGVAARTVRPDSSPATDGESLTRLLVQREENPLFQVRYAHARARALLRNAHDLGFGPEPGEEAYAAPEAGELLALLADQRRIEVADNPRRLVRQLRLVANAFFRFHHACPPLPSGDEKPGAAHRARLALVQATGVVLAGGLYRLGVSAPAYL